MPSMIQSPRRVTKPQAQAPVYATIDDMVASTRPSLPVYVFHPEKLRETAQQFLTGFPGTTMYAVKCNPDKAVVQGLIRAGIRNFDCASIEEVRLVRKLSPRAKIYFMHPIKAREAIVEAYQKYNVRAFVLDNVAELHKILQETNLAPDLELFVRVAIPKGAGVAVNLSGKFGASVEDTAALLQQCRPVAARLGVSFHVGSQCLMPERYAMAVGLAARAIQQSGVQVDALDVGGGFPVQYPNMAVPALSDFVGAIQAEIVQQKLTGLDLLCEPGRALVAPCGTLVVRIEQRKDTCLHLNDGTYGSLFEMGPSADMVLPHRLIHAASENSANLSPFTLAGPTCDSYDMMKGPFMLDATAREGDWIVFDMIGAYGTSSQTRFNGFGQVQRLQLQSSNVVDLHATAS
jgi:ornithine decarboxylase